MSLQVCHNRVLECFTNFQNPIFVSRTLKSLFNACITVWKQEKKIAHENLFSRKFEMIKFYLYLP